MHLLDFRTKLWSKLSIFVLAFILAIFPNAAMAAEAEAEDYDTENAFVADEDDGEQVAGEVDLESVIHGTSPDELKQHLIEARNDSGQNYLHLIKLDQFDLFADSVGDDVVVGDMLLEFAKDNYNSFARFVVENPINPRFANLVTARRSKEGDTLLMALAMRDGDAAKHLSTLTSKGIDISQPDIYGNTAKSLDNDYSQHCDYSISMTAKNPNMARYKSQGFDNALWQDILQDKYALYMRRLAGPKESTMDPFDFASIAFETVYTQSPTSVHAAFLLIEDSSSDQDRRRANDLWRGFFRAQDTLLADEDTAQAQRYPLSRRILNAVLDHQYRPELKKATAQLISGSSRFGVKFKKATEEEAETYVWGIRRYVQGFLSASSTNNFEDSANLLKISFYLNPLKQIASEKETWLRRHQLKCTVVALYSLNEVYDSYRQVKRAKKLSEDEVFGFIDNTLKMWTNETSINSNALFANVKSHLSADSEALYF